MNDTCLTDLLHTLCSSSNLTSSTNITHFTANNIKRNFLIWKCQQEGQWRQCQLSGQHRGTYRIVKLWVTLQPTANYINRTQFVQMFSCEYTTQTHSNALRESDDVRYTQEQDRMDITRTREWGIWTYDLNPRKRQKTPKGAEWVERKPASYPKTRTSNLGHDTCYTTSFRGFPESLQVNGGTAPQTRPQ